MNPLFWSLSVGIIVALLMARWGPRKWSNPLWMLIAMVLTALMLVVSE